VIVYFILLKGGFLRLVVDRLHRNHPLFGLPTNLYIVKFFKSGCNETGVLLMKSAVDLLDVRCEGK